VEYAANEMSASVGKKKGPDAAIPRTLRRLVQLADDDRRTGMKHIKETNEKKKYLVCIETSISLMDRPITWDASNKRPACL
jgi:hypothetical protein